MQTLIRGGDPSRSPWPPRPLVLVAEDDPRLASFLDRSLAAAGYGVQRVPVTTELLGASQRHNPDVVLLHAAPLDPDGLELARELRARTDVPIVLLSMQDSVDERVMGLDAGADDYLLIPFAVEELLARVRALLRGRALATAGARQGHLTYADLCLDLDTREVVRGSRKIELRNKAFELLACFMRRPERVLSRRDLLIEVWGYDFLGDSNVIEVTVSHIRQGLEAGGEPRLIHTVRPVGYMLNARG